ncbi:VP6 [Lebombo virus]|uniref:VP6 n=1 Tax=Lebombo virus TaxID=40057 RepID=W5QLW6_9REOV|nr:VP6 [Lebombo virus]AFX73384.1 VP6 [Lebombo virus]
MSSAYLLAPGDLILKATSELESRGIKIHIKEDKATEKGENSKDGEEKGVEQDVEVGSKAKQGGEGGEDRNGGKKSGDAANEGGGEDKDAKEGGGSITESADRKKLGSGDGLDARANRRFAVQDTSGKHQAGGGTAAGDEGQAGGCSGEKEEGVASSVATEAIADRLSQTINVNVPVWKKGMTLVILDMSAMKEIGLTKDDHYQQSDSLKSARAMDKSLKVQNVASKAKARMIFGGKDSDVPGATQLRESVIRHVSNRLEDVPKAIALFTAPTGDTGWKEVAKAAGKHPNIRAYVHTGEEDPIKPFLNLIDHI